MVPLHEVSRDCKLLPCSRSYRARSETFYELTTKGGAAILAAVVGEMAQESAALVAERLVEEGAELLAVVGIAGATSSDVRLGDVVAANLVDLYRNGAKAVPAGEAGFSLQLAGSSHPVPWHAVQALRDFKERPELKDAWLGWQERAAQRRAALGLDHAEALRLTRAQPDLLVGHIASGTDVAESQPLWIGLSSGIARTWRSRWRAVGSPPALTGGCKRFLWWSARGLRLRGRAQGRPRSLLGVLARRIMAAARGTTAIDLLIRYGCRTARSQGAGRRRKGRGHHPPSLSTRRGLVARAAWGASGDLR